MKYSIFDPTGNITALVEDAVEDSLQPSAAAEIMKKHPEVEQVGFVSLDGDVPALPTETMPDSATLRFVFNADGKPVAVVLYDPQDEEYSARFHALIDWVAVPREERYLLALAPQGREKAEKVLSGLTSWLLSSFSEG